MNTMCQEEKKESPLYLKEDLEAEQHPYQL